MDVELASMTVDQMAEGHLVSSLRAGDEIAGHRGLLLASVVSGPG